MNRIRFTQSRGRYISAVSSLICLLIVSQSAYAKPNKSILNQAKQNAPKVITCIDRQNYYDSLEELEIKFESCAQQVTLSLDIDRNDELSSSYFDALYEHIFEDEGFQNTMASIAARESLPITDPLYDTDDIGQALEDSLVGTYSLPTGSQSPEGGPGLALLPNRKYAVYSFGYAAGGDWRIVKGKYLHLIPYRVPQPYYVYGRHNSDLGQKSKIRFNGGDFSDATLVSFNDKPATPTELPKLTPVFNDGANCFSWPYEAVYPNTYKFLTLAYNADYKNKGDDAITTYTFNNEQGFNHFHALSFRKMSERKTMKFIIKDGELFAYSFSELEKLSKSELPEPDTENAQFFKYISTESTIADSLFYNPAGNEIQQFDLDPNNYSYDDKLKALVAINTCSDENCPPADDYHNYDIFYEYKRLDTISQNKSKFQLQPKPLIYSVCQEAERID
ncbi:hypothetical protein [Psychrobacter sp. FDAARGOS_221]|uniref:hypothetical protein n=1 Tax=Psychrobacter sp. FDAARGOS_221 TaxID=1975705 RepID=UPI000BB58272|nr:hypothetical protein [Psychrobacter sp. FDAARGOS_221]PNK59901.1 hypothetical protein A6J60_002750 [Psychrobacter sp. FDAARGOS_221]